jgi:Tfp pilus assembly protein PilN
VTLQELLNTDMDMASLSALARQGLAWWVDELSTMLPAAWRERLSSRPRTWIEPRDQGGWRTWRDGRVHEASPPPRDVKIGLLAPRGAVLERDLTIPRMPAADVRRMLTLDIDRLSPLAPDLIHFDLEIIDRDWEDGKQNVRLGILRRAEAERLLALARQDGFAPTALGTLSDRQGVTHFDFLPQTVAALGETRSGGTRLYAWLAAVALIVLNLGILVGRDMIAVDRQSQAVEGQQPVVDAVQRLRRRVETEDAARRGLLARGRRGDPLRMLNALTQAIPPGAWVQHLEWNGQSLRVVGFRRQDIDMAAAIRGSGAFTNPRALTAEPATGATSTHPFDITADARPERPAGTRP